MSTWAVRAHGFGRSSLESPAVEPSQLLPWRWPGIEFDKTTSASPPRHPRAREVNPYMRDRGLRGQMPYYERGGAKVFASGILDFPSAAYYSPYGRALENVCGPALEAVGDGEAPSQRGRLGSRLARVTVRHRREDAGHRDEDDMPVPHLLPRIHGVDDSKRVDLSVVALRVRPRPDAAGRGDVLAGLHPERVQRSWHEEPRVDRVDRDAALQVEVAAPADTATSGRRRRSSRCRARSLFVVVKTARLLPLRAASIAVPSLHLEQQLPARRVDADAARSAAEPIVAGPERHRADDGDAARRRATRRRSPPGRRRAA